MNTKITNPTVWQQGYLARAAEEDAVKAALLAACKALLSCRWVAETVSVEADALRAAIAAAEGRDA